jgi:hypothetical protein
VALLLWKDKPLKQLAQELVIDPKSLREWLRRLVPPAPSRSTEELEANLHVLRWENDSLRAHRDILTNAGHPIQSVAKRHALMNALSQDHPVKEPYPSPVDPDYRTAKSSPAAVPQSQDHYVHL